MEEKVPNNNFCEPDDEINFYKIIVIATNYGNNVATSTTTILVVPKSVNKEQLMNNTFMKTISKKMKRFVLHEAKIEYNSN